MNPLRPAVTRVRASELYEGVVTAEELDSLLTRVRSAAEAALRDNKHFWLA